MDNNKTSTQINRMCVRVITVYEACDNVQISEIMTPSNSACRTGQTTDESKVLQTTDESKVLTYKNTPSTEELQCISV